MGLIQAGLGALQSTLTDQWKEFFYCDALDNNTLVMRGRKKTSSRSSNTKGDDNIISDGSGIAVADGQCMIIVDQGEIVEFCAEPGEYTFDKSSEPSIFSGEFGESIVAMFKNLVKRFTYGGDTGRDQRVYYFNTKEISGNKYGTANPIPFRVVINEALGYKLSVDLRCHGEYSYKITNPMLFYRNVCGNVANRFERDEIDSILKSELLTALQPALAKVAAQGIEYYEIPAHTIEIRDALNEVLSKDWAEKRGISVFSFGVNSLTIPDEQKKKITEWEENAMTINPNTAAARLVTAQAEAMKTAAGNAGGAALGFMNMNMAAQSGGANAANLYQMAAQQPQPAQAVPAKADDKDTWVCTCGAKSTGKFCPECGAQKPADGWVCSCGAVNKGKFCMECGAKKPAAAPLYRCDKCGWEPEDPKNPPKFCPECGDRFDDADIR